MWRALGQLRTQVSSIVFVPVRGIRARLPPISKLPLKALYVQQLKKDLESSAGLIVVQSLNWNEDENAKARLDLKREKVVVRHVKNTLMRLALEETGWRALMPIFVGSNDVVFIPKPELAPQVSRTLLALPECIPIAGSLSNTLLDVQDIRELSKIQDATEVYSRIVGTLQQPAMALASVLTAPTRTIVASLQHRAKSAEEEQSKPSSPDA